MSTILVSKKHIDVIVTAYYTYEVEADIIFGTNRNKNFDKIGQILWKHNYRSFSMTNNTAKKEPKYYFTKRPANLWQVFKAIESLDRQSCNSTNYNRSKAKKVLNSLRELVMRKIVTSSQEYNKAESLIK